jgi:hypothetical protein
LKYETTALETKKKAIKKYTRSQPPFKSREGTSRNNYPREQNDTVPVGKPWGKWRLTHGFSGPLASRNPNTGHNSKAIGFQNRFDAFDKRKNNRGFGHENNFQE